MVRRNCRRGLICIRNILCFLLILTFIAVYKIRSYRYEEISHIIRSSKMEHLFVPSNNSPRQLNISEIENTIRARNKEQTIFNREVYGPIKQDTVIMVISVDKPSTNLKFMILSLSQIKGIQDVLLVFSHSRYNEELNDIIKAIEFCRVLQIFYPYSLQLYPNQFPGFTPGDCAYHHSLNEAEHLKCTGASNPDIHGRFRSPELSEKKHHWWWTANQVFENLNTVEAHDGLVVFIEDTYMFMEDFLYMTIFMKKIASTITGCELLSLAASIPPSVGQEATVEVIAWDATLHSAVVAFDLSTWNSIVSHYDRFCDIDDYSWAESLAYLSLNRIDGDKYRVMTSKFPRAYKSDACIYFGSYMDCDVHTGVQQLYNLQERMSKFMYPTYLEVFVVIEFEDEYTSFDYVDLNGGFNDLRDKAFCRNLTVYKIKKEIMRMNHQFDDVHE